MRKRKKAKKDKCSNPDVWTEEQYEEYMKDLYGMEYIAGYTENGVPYGIFIGEDVENNESLIRDISIDNGVPYGIFTGEDEENDESIIRDIPKDILRDISIDSDDELPF